MKQRTKKTNIILYSYQIEFSNIWLVPLRAGATLFFFIYFISYPLRVMTSLRDYPKDIFRKSKKQQQFFFQNLTFVFYTYYYTTTFHDYYNYFMYIGIICE